VEGFIMEKDDKKWVVTIKHGDITDRYEVSTWHMEDAIILAKAEAIKAHKTHEGSISVWEI
jgi:hypothetical protein